MTRQRQTNLHQKGKFDYQRHALVIQIFQRIKLHFIVLELTKKKKPWKRFDMAFDELKRSTILSPLSPLANLFLLAGDIHATLILVQKPYITSSSQWNNNNHYNTVWSQQSPQYEQTLWSKTWCPSLPNNN